MIAASLVFALMFQPPVMGQVELCGMVTQRFWNDPNVVIEVDVKQAGPGVTLGPWRIEAPTRSKLVRSGVTYDSLRPGSLVKLTAIPLPTICSGVCQAHTQDIRTGFVGVASTSSGPIVTRPTSCAEIR